MAKIKNDEEFFAVIDSLAMSGAKSKRSKHSAKKQKWRYLPNGARKSTP